MRIRHSPATVIGNESQTMPLSRQQPDGKAWRVGLNREPGDRKISRISNRFRGKARKVPMQTKHILRITAFFISTQILQAAHFHHSNTQSNGSISGYITNRETGHSIPDANIIVEGTLFGTASGDGGYYSLRNIPYGKYAITVRVIGYRSETVNDIQIRDNTSLDIALEPTVIPMNPIVVTATGYAHLLSNVSVSSDIFTTAHFQEKNGTTVGEIVETAGGVLVKDNGGFAGLKTLSIRGSEAAHVLVLLDGQRLNSATMGGVDINAIPVEGLERIEIIRGGHSALMGTDAVGGTVNLITNESIPPKGFAYGIRSMLGSFGTQSINLYGSHRLGPVMSFLSLNRIQSNGDFLFRHAETNADSIRKNNDFSGDALFFKSKIRLGRHSELRFIHNFFQSGRGAAGSITWPTPLARRKENRRLTSLEYEDQVSPQFRMKMKSYLHKNDQRFNDPGGWIPVDSRHENNIIGADAQVRWTPTSAFILTTGGEIRQERLSSTDLGEQNRLTRGFYVQSEIGRAFRLFRQPIYIRWIPAMRWDGYSEMRSQVCPKIGFIISSGQSANISIRGNLGRSFRVPSFNDLYWPEDAFARGNPDLKPEVGTNLDIGLSLSRIRTNLFQIDLTYFRNDITDLIIWESGPDWIWTPKNVGRTRISGLESGWTFRFPDNRAYLQMSHTWMQAVDKTLSSPDEEKRLIYRPDHKFDVSAGLTLGRFDANLNYRIVGKRYTSADNTTSLPAYKLLNGNINYVFVLSELTIRTKVQVQNLLNGSVYILEGYPIPGREFRLSVNIEY